MNRQRIVAAAALLAFGGAVARGQAVLTTGDSSSVPRVIVFPTPATGLPAPTQQNSTVPPDAVPHGLSWFDPDHVLVGDLFNSRAFVVEVSTHTYQDVIPTDGKWDGSGTIAVSPSQEYALAVGSLEQLAVIHAPFTAQSVVTVVPLTGGAPSAQTQVIVFDASGRAYVSANGIHVLDPPYTSVAFTMPFLAGGLAVTGDGQTLLATTAFEQVSVFTAPFSASSVPANIAIPAASILDGIALTPDESKALVVDFGFGMKDFFVVSAPFGSSSNVQAITLDTTDQRLEDVAISEDGQLAILTGVSGPSAYFVTAPFTTAGATVHKVLIPDGGRGDGCARFRVTDVKVTGITPTSGPASGGTAVTVAGTSFAAGAGLKIGGAAASGVDVAGPTSVEGVTPAVAPGTLHGVTVTNLNGRLGTLPKGWLADFLDVPHADPFHPFVESLIRYGVTAGCGGGNYCRNNPVTRGAMAVFILKSKYGAGHTPPACVGIFTDVPCTPGTGFSDWIEELYALGITGGCGVAPLRYCPGNPVTRAQMAVFLLKGEHGSAYDPPDCTDVFTDVPCTPGTGFSDWIERLYAEEVTGGCDTNPLRYCPGNPATRGQMAVFLTKTFELP